MSDDERGLAERSGQSEHRSAAITYACWLAVLTFTAAFHAIRGAEVDAWIFAGGAVAVALDALGWLRVPLFRRRSAVRPPRAIAIAALIAAVSALIAVAPLHGGADTAIVVGFGLLLLPAAWVGPGAGRPESLPHPAAGSSTGPRLRRTAIVWATLIAGGCAWEIGAYLLGSRSPQADLQFPALSDLIDPLLTIPLARGALVALWLAGGYVLLRRGRAHDREPRRRTQP